MEQTECSETSAYKIQMPGNHPKERIRHSKHGESLKSRAFQVIVNNVKILSFISTVLTRIQTFRSISYMTVFLHFSRIWLKITLRLNIFIINFRFVIYCW